MSETPRTDEFWDNQPLERPVLSEAREFAQQLERELSEAQQQIEANHEVTLVIERMLYEAREQRDKLIAACQNLVDMNGRHNVMLAYRQMEEVLTEVKGGEMNDTPRTDEIARGNHVVPTEWAQDLERELNHANKDLKQIIRLTAILEDIQNLVTTDHESKESFINRVRAVFER